ncbi:MAG TPA: hypothetical protein VLD38_01265 [Nitrosopumilaceae archaeon]|nr:hypothetical protein [Nitrosopumilaceae archaeon]
MLNPQHLAENKPTLFSIVVFSVVGILAIPIILPHIFHGTHIYHIFLHLGGIAISLFLTIVSALAYHKVRTKRLCFTMIAFGVFISSEIFYLIEATWPFTFYFGEISMLEAGHILVLIMLGIFTLAIFRKD